MHPALKHFSVITKINYLMALREHDDTFCLSTCGTLLNAVNSYDTTLRRLSVNPVDDCFEKRIGAVGVQTPCFEQM